MPPLAGKKLRWDCSNIFCPKKQKQVVKIGDVIVTNTGRKK